jgi:hypothetical protein
MMENTHTSHSCLQSHQNFHIGLSSNKTLHFLVVEPFGLQKKGASMDETSKWENSYACYP